jgi:hypothetical protein
MRTPSIVPHDAERDTYLVLDDFGGRLGCAWRETDAESADRATIIRDLLDVHSLQSHRQMGVMKQDCNSQHRISESAADAPRPGQ